MSTFTFNRLGKEFKVQGPPGATEAQALAVFDQQYKTGTLVGLDAGDIINAGSQAAGGVPGATGVVGQRLSGVPGSTVGATGTAFNSVGKSFVSANEESAGISRLRNATLALGAISRVGQVFSTPVTNGITTADFATTAPALSTIAGLSTTNVRATVASVGAGTGQAYTDFSDSAGCGKYGFSATQLESAGYLKPGTAGTYLGQGSNDLTTVLKSPAVWTGKGGINSLDTFLTNPAAQDSAQQNLMSSGLASAATLGVPISSLGVKDTAGMAANFAKSPAAGADWIQGRLPAAEQASFDQRFKNAQFAVGSDESKMNDALLQQTPPGEAVDTVNRATLAAATSRVIGSDKIPSINYDGPIPPPSVLFAENKRLNNLTKAQQSKIAELGSQEISAKTADAQIAQYEAIRKALLIISKEYQSLQKDVAGKPYTEFIAEVDAGLATVLVLIADIVDQYIPNLRRIKGG
jgi:hypothetical protein